MFYTIPNFQNPLGITASVERRKAVLDLAIKHEFLILEDDAYVELRFEGTHLPSYYELDGSRSQVLRAGTFSKIFGAGIRLGWTMSSPELLAALTHYKLDGGTSPFSSRILTEYMRGHMFEHIGELIEVYRNKRDVMIGGLQRDSARAPPGVSPRADSSYGSRFRQVPAPRRFARHVPDAECLSGTARSFDGTVRTIATFASHIASPLRKRSKRAWPSSARRSSNRRPGRARS